jgi:hypothetical protein
MKNELNKIGIFMKNVILILLSVFLVSGAYSASIQEMLGFDSPQEQDIYSNTILTETKKSDILSMVESTFKEASGQTNDEDDPDVSYTGFEPNDLYEAYYDIAEELYSGGYAKKAHFDSYLSSYNSLNNFVVTAPTDSDDKIAFWWSQYETVWHNYIVSIQNSPQSCAGEGVPSSVRKCCPGLVEMTLYKVVGKSCKSSAVSCSNGTECCSGICNKDNAAAGGICAPLSCKPTGNSCNSNSDCCSSLCNKPNSGSPGRCTTPKQCYKPVAAGEQCGTALTPLCLVGECKTINSETYGGECKQISASCTVSSDCCSNKCSSNKCVSNSICKDCALKNTTPKSGQSCCEGLYLDGLSGKCRTDIIPMDFVLPQTSSTNFIQKILNLIIPSAHAARSVEDAERLSIERSQQNCKEQHSPSSSPSEYRACMEMASNLVATTAIERVGLTPEQKKIIDAEEKRCHSEYPVGSISRKECTHKNDKEEQRLVRENTENGVDTGDTKAADLIKKYKATAITEKTYSAPKKCEFRSYNDNWRAASNVEKNAEVFLRSFEFVYSGDGTQDFWRDGDKGNIWTRANNVAKKFRENRSKLINKLKETDIKMTCQCIAIWGPANFDAAKQAFFASDICKEERAKVMSVMGAGVDEHKDDDSNKDADGNSDIASLKSTESEDADKLNTAKMEEIDKGAAAISHEKLLIEWLGMRAEAQMDRFTDNSELEKELIELSTFISEKDFAEVWKGEIKNKGKVLDKGTPEGDNVLLYRFGVKYYKGWVKLFIIMVAIGLGVTAAYLVISGLATAALGAGAAWGLTGTGIATLVSAGALGGLLGGVVAGMLGAYSGKAMPNVGDLQVFKKKSYSFFKNWDGYERYYLGPLYDNKSPDEETDCRIFSRASACLKSGYQVKLDNMKYLTEYEGRHHFVIDTNRPLYATASKYSLKKMPGLSLDWKEIVNKMRTDAVTFLTNTKPGGGTKSKGGKSYVVKKTKYLKTDVFQMAVDAKHFLPMRGQFNPVQFDQKADLKKAAVKYAMCREMKLASDKNCFIADASVKDEDVGFGYLFESETEAADFAEYTYEMHFLYSQISKSDYLGYPLLGQDAYFRAVAYNMKLVGSLASQRAMNYGETYDLYQADWEQRIGDYKALSENEIGSGSRNIKYSKKFYKAFGLLDFDDQISRENFDAVQASAAATGGFSKAEIRALDAKKQSALRTREQSKKISAYNKQRGSNTLSLKRNANAAKFMQKLNSPLAGFKMNKLGGGSGYGNVADALSSLNKNIKGLNKRLKRNKRTGGSSYSGFTMPKSMNYSGSSSNVSSGSDSLDDSNSSSGLAQHMSDSDARKIINGLGKGKSLDPDGDDSLWTILSKAYKRNYSKVLLRSNSLESEKFDEVNSARKKQKNAPDNIEKARLKQLLDAN